MSFFTKFVLFAIPLWELSHIGLQCSGWCTFGIYMVYFYILQGNGNNTMRIAESLQRILQLLHCTNYATCDWMLIFLFCLYIHSQKKDAGACNNVGHACNNVPPDTMHSFRKTWRYYKSQEKRMNKGIHIVECWHWIYGYVWVRPEPILSWSWRTLLRELRRKKEIGQLSSTVRNKKTFDLLFYGLCTFTFLRKNATEFGSHRMSHVKCFLSNVTRFWINIPIGNSTHVRHGTIPS